MEMKTRHNDLYESDSTPSVEVAQRYREAIYDDDQDVSLALLTYRGGEHEFIIGKSYRASEDAGDRATGADILAQLGWADQTFLEDSSKILIGLLDDLDEHVVNA